MFTLASTFWIVCIIFKNENLNKWFAVFVMKRIISQMWEYNFPSKACRTSGVIKLVIRRIKQNRVSIHNDVLYNINSIFTEVAQANF